jgi:hypothetical protein
LFARLEKLHFFVCFFISHFDAYPILAKNGYTAIGYSTLTADRMLHPKEEYPILAKNGYAAIG